MEDVFVMQLQEIYYEQDPLLIRQVPGGEKVIR